MSFTDLTLFARIVGPLTVSVLAYFFWRYVKNRDNCEGPGNALLVVTYIATRLGLWLIFAVYMQHYVTSSDPRLFYTPQLEHFLAGKVPIRDFFYPYGPLLMPSMLPLYLLLGHSLAGISLFAIFTEAVALFFVLKCTSLLEHRGEIEHSWVKEALAVYLLNPATLYWTVVQGYNSIVQTAYAMGAFYFLLRSHYKTGYAVGLYGLAGSKILAILDWPSLLGICRPRLTKLLLGAIPLLLTYVVYQMITGDFLFPPSTSNHSSGGVIPTRLLPFYLINIRYEGNIWYLLTLFGDPHNFYSSFPGNLLPVLLFGICFLLGFGYWLKYLRLGLTSFSFQMALGITTFTMCVFFLCSFYGSDYYIPMLMLPASLVVTSPALRYRRGVCDLLLISGFSIASDAIWTSLGQPAALIDAFSAGSFSKQLLATLLIVTILVRMACFVRLAQLGLRLATAKLLHAQTTLSASQSSKLGRSVGILPKVDFDFETERRD